MIKINRIIRLNRIKQGEELSKLIISIKTASPIYPIYPIYTLISWVKRCFFLSVKTVALLRLIFTSCMKSPANQICNYTHLHARSVYNKENVQNQPI